MPGTVVTAGKHFPTYVTLEAFVGAQMLLVEALVGKGCTAKLKWKM